MAFFRAWSHQYETRGRQKPSSKVNVLKSIAQGEQLPTRLFFVSVDVLYTLPIAKTMTSICTVVKNLHVASKGPPSSSTRLTGLHSNEDSVVDQEKTDDIYKAT